MWGLGGPLLLIYATIHETIHTLIYPLTMQSKLFAAPFKHALTLRHKEGKAAACLAVSARGFTAFAEAQKSACQGLGLT